MARLAFAIALLAGASPAAAASLQVLHNFTGAAAAGGQLPDALTLNNGILYGGTDDHAPGGSVLFAANATSGQTTILQVLQSGPNPFGYGMSALFNFGPDEIGIEPSGGNGNGAFVVLNTQAGTLSTLYEFTGGSDGALPAGPLTLCSGAFYGTAARGGAYGQGTIYQAAFGHGTVPVVYSFRGTYDGAQPLGALACLNNILFGVAGNGGAAGKGTLFAVNPQTGTELTLRSFGSGTMSEYGALGLFAYGGYIYGNVQYFGPSGYGGIFRYDVGHNAYSMVLPFGYGNGGWPLAVTLAGNVLYGSTSTGGTGKSGTLYSYNLDTGASATLYNFTGKADGGAPFLGGLVYANGVLYGTTSQGGANGFGTLYKFTP